MKPRKATKRRTPPIPTYHHYRPEGATIVPSPDIRPAPTEDLISHPPHYTSHPSGIETIQITKHESFLRGNVLEYVLRAPYKGTELQDLEKARQYLDWEIDGVRAKQGPASAESLPTVGDLAADVREKTSTADDVAAWAKEVLGIELLPWQRRFMDAYFAGEPVILRGGQRGGKATVRKVIAEYEAQVKAAEVLRDEAVDAIAASGRHGRYFSGGYIQHKPWITLTDAQRTQYSLTGQFTFTAEQVAQCRWHNGNLYAPK